MMLSIGQEQDITRKSMLREDGVYVQFGYPGMEGPYYKSAKCWYAMARVVFDSTNASLYRFGDYANPIYFKGTPPTAIGYCGYNDTPDYLASGMIYRTNEGNSIWCRPDIDICTKWYQNEKDRITTCPPVSVFDYISVHKEAPIMDVMNAIRDLPNNKLDLHNDSFGLQLLVTPVADTKAFNVETCETEVIFKNKRTLGYYRSKYYNNGGCIMMKSTDPHIIHIYGETEEMDDYDSHNHPYVFIPNDRTEDTWGWRDSIEKWEKHRHME